MAMFNERKVAQMAAYFLGERGGRMSLLKLMKLLYLAERESLRLYGLPMSGDHVVAMDHGPVLSQTLNLMNGTIEPTADGWPEWVSDREDYEVSLAKPSLSRDDLDELSDADVEILKNVWEEFGTMTRWKIRDYTHQHCPEWQDPHGSSLPITYEQIFVALHHSHEAARQLAARIEDEQTIDRLFHSL
jgi:uncharacterized phage-associated protein